LGDGDGVGGAGCRVVDATAGDSDGVCDALDGGFAEDDSDENGEDGGWRVTKCTAAAG